MCSAPVTFGGGIAIEKFSSGLPSAGGSKAPLPSHASKTRLSAPAGSQRVVASSISRRASSIEAASVVALSGARSGPRRVGSGRFLAELELGVRVLLDRLGDEGREPGRCSIVSRVTTHLETSRREGSSNWTSISVSSRIERRPRAPVSRSSALSAIAPSESSWKLSSISSNSKKRWNWRVSALRGSVRIVIRSSRVSWWIAAITGSRPMNSGISPYSIRSSGSTCSNSSPVSFWLFEVTSAPKPDPLAADPALDHVVELGERAAADEEDVGRVDGQELLVGVLAPALRGHRRGRPLEDLQQRLLDALAGDVAGDRRVVGLAGDLVDLVDVDDPCLGLLDVEVGRLDQLQEDVLDVLADVAGLGERGRVGDRERDVEDPRQGLGEQRLAAAGRAEQHDVRLLQLDLALAGVLASSGRACSGCRRRPRAPAWRSPGRPRTPAAPRRSRAASAGSRARRSAAR